MKVRNLISIKDLTVGDIEEIFATAAEQKAALARGKLNPVLEGKTLGMIFEKPSLRTRVSFEVAMTQLGGHAIFLSQAEVKMGQREAIKDLARVLSRYVDGITARVFDHRHVVELAEHSRVPVVNALSDFLHPCQALADIFTMKEIFGDLEGRKLCFVGDGNNVARSLAFICAKMGIRFALAAPEGYQLARDFLDQVRSAAGRDDVDLAVGTDPRRLVEGSGVVYTDVWASMGQEREAAERKKEFAAYQVNSELLALARPEAVAMHCLPAHRGEEITDDVMDGPKAAMYDEAENRLHTARAVLTLLMA